MGLFVFFWTNSFTYAQVDKQKVSQARLDSLQSKLNSAKGYEKISVLNQLSASIRPKDLNKSLEYAENALKLAEQLRYSEGTAEALDNLGVIHIANAKYNESLRYNLQALKTYQMLRKADKEAKILNRVGTTQFRLGNFPEALNYLLQAKSAFESLKDYRGLSRVLNNLGLVYQEQKNYVKAEQVYQNALEFSREQKSEEEIAGLLNNLGLVSHSQAQYEKSRTYFNEALAIQQKLKNQNEIAGIYNNIGEVYQSQGYHDQALDYYNRSVELKSQTNDKEGLTYTLANLAKLHISIKQPQKALEFAEKSLKISEEISAKARVRDASLILAETYSNLQNYQKAYQYYQVYMAMKDSLFNKEKTSLIEKIQIEYEINMMEKENRTLRQERAKFEEQVKEQRARYQLIRSATYFLGGLAILVTLLTFILYRTVIARRNANLELRRIVSERNANLEKLNNELLRTNAELDNFLYKVSHDLKGPISSLEGLTNIGIMDVSDPVAQKYFEMQKKVIHNTQLLIFRIVEIGDIRNHKTTSSKIQMKKFMRQMVRSMSRAEEANGVEINVDVPEDLVLETDPEMLEIAMDNIIKNAMQHAKYFNTNSVAKVRIEFKATEEFCEIFIVDNGQGISADIADKIFEMFFKGNNYFKGFGLGLYKSKIAVEKMRGEIKLYKSDANETTFAIKIPKSI